MPSDSDGGASRSGMTKPNCTITARHNRLLDEMATGRYASRSEALRVAIEDLYQSLEDDSQQPIQHLRTDIETVLEILEEVADQVAELQSAASGPLVHQNVTNSTAGQAEPIASAMQTTNGDDWVDEQVYTVISKREFVSEPAIAEECELSQLRVHESLLRLVKRGLVTSIQDDQTVLYRPAPV